jgi:hypothetical protein
MDKAQYDKLKFLLEPCQTADDLDKYLRYWLKLELPWDTVDEESTSSPLKLVWAVYKVLMTGQGPSKHVVAAARNTAKTVDASVIQFLSLLHFRRDGAHIASILDQSMTAIRYLDTYMNIPELVPYRNIDNVRLKQFTHLPPNDYTTKSESSLRVVTATKKGANSPRASLLTLDEVDLTPPEVISEVAFIADPTRDGHRFNPVFVYLSSRKTNDGPIQKLQDQALEPKAVGQKRIKLHKWSHADFMERCKEEIHKPELGPQMAYIHTESLETVWGKDKFLATAPDSIRPSYREISAFEGCKTCPAFIACQGRSPKQRGDSQMLRTREFVGDILEAVGDPQVIIAQSLNWKPESSAIVFKSFGPKHIMLPTDFYEWVIGTPYNPDNLPKDELKALLDEGHNEGFGTSAQIARITPTKLDIYKAMVASGWTIFAGCDWGYNPDPAVVIVAGYHKKSRRLAVLHTANAINHANHVWAQHIAEQVYPFMPFEYIGPDMADPASPTYFAKYKIRSLDYKPPRIETGVSFLRGLLWNPIIQQASFAVLDDSQDYPGKQELGREQGNWMLISAMQRWTHKKLATGGWDMTKFEDNKWTHPIDALRYGLDPMIEEARIGIASHLGPSELNIEVRVAQEDPEAVAIAKQKNEMMTQVREHFASEFGLDNIFKEQNKLIANPDADKKPKPQGAIRFKF